MQYRREQIALFPVVWAIVFAVHFAAAAQTPPQRVDVYYYNGAQRVDIELALDELAVVPPPGNAVSALALAAVAPSGVVFERPDGGADLQFARRAADIAELRTLAASLRSPFYSVGAVAYKNADAAARGLRYVVRNRFSLKLRNDTNLARVLDDHDLRLIGDAPHGEGIYIVEPESGELLVGLQTANTLVESGEAEFATPLIDKPRVPRLIPNDPFFPDQWHLLNEPSGNDLNVVTIWDEFTGAGVNIAITDTGVDTDHPDLQANIRFDIDFDVQENDNDPNSENDDHGVSVAGVAAAKGNNGIGVAGSGFDAGIVGLRLIDNTSANDAEEATALGWGADETVAADYIHVNNNSWGPPDGGSFRETWGPLTEAAVEAGVTNGRGGRGSIYVWAAGNGGLVDDVNYDGYASSRYTIAVGASTSTGSAPSFTERGASLLINAPGSGIHTTKGSGGFDPGFTGTSASAPAAAGVIALMLEANPNLGWRDVQQILVDTSFQNDPGNGGWTANGSGRLFHHRFGYGRIDAGAAVNRARDWVPIETEEAIVFGGSTVSLKIPNGTGEVVSDSIDVGVVDENVFVEHVEVFFSATHADGGDLSIELVAPSGQRSIFARPHNETDDYNQWKFTSVAHWGENPSGVWTLEVRDTVSGNSGDFDSWWITLYGMRVDADHIHVDNAFIGFEDGSPNRPLTNLADAMDRVNTGGTVHVNPGEYADTALFDKPARVVAEAGTVRLLAP